MTDQPKRMDTDVAPGPATAGAGAQLSGDDQMERITAELIAKQRRVHELCERFETAFVAEGDDDIAVCGKAMVVAVDASMVGNGVDPIVVAGLARRLAAIVDPDPYPDPPSITDIRDAKL